MVKEPKVMIAGAITEIEKLSKSPTGILSKAKIDIVTSGDNTIIPLSAGKKHKIVKIWFVCAGAVDVTFKEGATAITGAMSFGQGGGLADDGDLNPIEIATGQAFVINLSAAVQVSGMVRYVTE